MLDSIAALELSDAEREGILGANTLRLLRLND
jgi:predicted TIM-barrel fold metal-dependent hydrolase